MAVVPPRETHPAALPEAAVVSIVQTKNEPLPQHITELAPAPDAQVPTATGRVSEGLSSEQLRADVMDLPQKQLIIASTIRPVVAAKISVEAAEAAAVVPELEGALHSKIAAAPENLTQPPAQEFYNDTASPGDSVIKPMQIRDEADDHAVFETADAVEPNFKAAPIEAETKTWTQPELQPQLELELKPESTPATIVLSRIQEAIELPEETVKQIETLLQALPETMRDGLVEFTESGETEAVLGTEELLVKIAEAADRLHELAMADQLETLEAEEIQQLLGEWYEELSITLDLEVDEQAPITFIELVCSEDYQPAPAKIEPRVILASIQGNLEVPDTVIEQTEILLQALPEALQAQLQDFVEAADPETVVAAEELVVKMAKTADRLHELAMADNRLGPEAEQINLLLSEQYEELLVTLGREIEPETIAAFIKLVCSEDYQSAPAAAVEEASDEAFRQRLRRLGPLAVMSGAVQIGQTMCGEIARLMVQNTAGVSGESPYRQSYRAFSSTSV